MSVQHQATRHNEVTEQVLDVQRAFKKSVCYGQLLADASCTVIAVLSANLQKLLLLLAFFGSYQIASGSLAPPSGLKEG